MGTSGKISVNFPASIEVHAPSASLADGAPGSETGFSVEAQGTGSFTGLSYTVPAHASGTLKADVQVMAITSADVDKLNRLVSSMLSSSAKSKVEEHEKIHASADISFWSLITGSGSASYDKTKDSMHSLGLTDDQVTKIIEGLFEAAQKMSHVELDFTIDNTENDYSVSGDLQLYTMSGKITTSKGTSQYRLLANKGTAGSGGETAPAEGKVIPLS